MGLKFRGNYDEIQTAVLCADLQGFWREPKNGRKQYCSYEGGLLNWWPTGTITFHGYTPAAREELKKAFIEANERHLIGECDGRKFYGVPTRR
jgi:hypothetical protein